MCSFSLLGGAQELSTASSAATSDGTGIRPPATTMPPQGAGRPSPKRSAPDHLAEKVHNVIPTGGENSTTMVDAATSPPHCPPNGPGITMLVMLNILSRFDLTKFAPVSIERFYVEAEAARIAYMMREQFIGDPQQVDVDVARILAKNFAEEHVSKIRMDRVLELPNVAPPMNPSTISCTARSMKTVRNTSGSASTAHSINLAHSWRAAMSSGLPARPARTSDVSSDAGSRAFM